MSNDNLQFPAKGDPSVSPERHSTPPPSWNVFLRSPATSRSHQPHWLAGLLGLDVYGTSLLSRRAATEMGFVATVLAVIFLFDLAAWSLLFNAVIHSTVDDIDLLTPLAVLGGALFAFAILTYERQFVTADTSSGLRRVLLPMALRLLVITASAIITAQPIELLFFRGPIMNHTHKELVREHAAGLLFDLDTLQERAREAAEIPESISNGPEAQRLHRHDRKVEEQEKEIQTLQDQLLEVERKHRDWSWAKQVRSKELGQAKDQLDRLRSAPRVTEAALAEAQQALATAQKKHANADRRSRNFAVLARDLKEELGVEEERLNTLRGEREPIYESLREVLDTGRVQSASNEDALEREAQRIRRWFQKLVALEPGGETVAEEIGGITYTFEPRVYDFFEQLRVLDDLRSARFPQWPGSTTDEIRDLAATFGVRDLKNCHEVRCTPEENTSWEGHRARARLFYWSSIVVYGIAVIIPCLVIAIKMLLPPELKAYYSGRHQAAAGNSEAMDLLTVERIVESES